MSQLNMNANGKLFLWKQSWILGKDVMKVAKSNCWTKCGKTIEKNRLKKFQPSDFLAGVLKFSSHFKETKTIYFEWSKTIRGHVKKRLWSYIKRLAKIYTFIVLKRKVFILLWFPKIFFLHGSIITVNHFSNGFYSIYFYFYFHKGFRQLTKK